MVAVPGITEILDLTYETNLKYIFDLYHLMPPHLFENASRAIKKEYFGDGLITGNELGFKKMTTDGFFSNAFYEQIIRYARHSNQPMYNFRDCFRGVFSTSTETSIIQTSKNYGASHVDAGLYAILDGLTDKKFRLKGKDKAMMEFMTELFYSFMVDGKPSVADKLGWTPQPRTSEEVHYLRFENPYRMYMKKDDNYGNRKFWQSLPINRYYGYPDDFCELDERKSANRHKAHENQKPDDTDKNQQNHDCKDENGVQKDKEKQAHENNRNHEQQNACDQNNADNVKKELDQQQNVDKQHHQDEEKLQHFQHQDCNDENGSKTDGEKQKDDHERHHSQLNDQQNACDQEEELQRQQNSDEQHCS